MLHSLSWPPGGNTYVLYIFVSLCLLPRTSLSFCLSSGLLSATRPLPDSLTTWEIKAVGIFQNGEFSFMLSSPSFITSILPFLSFLPFFSPSFQFLQVSQVFICVTKFVLPRESSVLPVSAWGLYRLLFPSDPESCVVGAIAPGRGSKGKELSHLAQQR